MEQDEFTFLAQSARDTVAEEMLEDIILRTRAPGS
jgi:hypothetical protein